MRMRPGLLIPGVVLGLGLTVAALAGFRDTAFQTTITRPVAAGLEPDQASQDKKRQNSASSPILPFRSDQPKTAAGRRYPVVPTNPQTAATLLAAVEIALRDPSTPDQDLPDLGHQQQVIYRVLSADIPRSQLVLAALPERWHSVAERHLAARREFLRMSRGRRPTRLPAWRIIQPEPADRLLQHYRKATGNLEGTGVSFGGKFRNVFRWEQEFKVARRAEVFMQKCSRAATRDNRTFNEHGIGYFDSKASLQATGSLFQASSNER